MFVLYPGGGNVTLIKQMYIMGIPVSGGVPTIPQQIAEPVVPKMPGKCVLQHTHKYVRHLWHHRTRAKIVQMSGEPMARNTVAAVIAKITGAIAIIAIIAMA